MASINPLILVRDHSFVNHQDRQDNFFQTKHDPTCRLKPNNHNKPPAEPMFRYVVQRMKDPKIKAYQPELSVSR